MSKDFISAPVHTVSTERLFRETRRREHEADRAYEKFIHEVNDREAVRERTHRSITQRDIWKLCLNGTVPALMVMAFFVGAVIATLERML